MNPALTCLNCRFWNGDREAKGWGECRAHPPVVVAFSGMVYKDGSSEGPETNTQWPMTRYGEWCGEHEPQAGMLP